MNYYQCTECLEFFDELGNQVNATDGVCVTYEDDAWENGNYYGKTYTSVVMACDIAETDYVCSWCENEAEK
jgi:hypothetical protein